MQALARVALSNDDSTNLSPTETVAMMRNNCVTPLNLAYTCTHKGTGVAQVARFSEFAVRSAFPRHADPRKPTLGTLVELVDNWNKRPNQEHAYALVQLPS